MLEKSSALRWLKKSGLKRNNALSMAIQTHVKLLYLRMARDMNKLAIYYRHRNQMGFVTICRRSRDEYIKLIRQGLA